MECTWMQRWEETGDYNVTGIGIYFPAFQLAAEQVNVTETDPNL